MIDITKADLVFNDIAVNLSALSKCQFTQVGCIIVNETGRIISTGVNGTVSGQPNCSEIKFEKRDDHLQWADDNEIHAEMNAILELARSSAIPSKISIYTSISPCKNCLKHLFGLISSGVTRIDKIVYNEKYHRLTDKDLLTMEKRCSENGVTLLCVDDIIAELSNEVVFYPHYLRNSDEFQSQATRPTEG